MPHPVPVNAPAAPTTEPSTAPNANPQSQYRFHRTYSDLPEHQNPTLTDPIPTHGSPLSSRLHRRLEGIRAAISRESDLQSPPSPPLLHPSTITSNPAQYRRGSDGSDGSSGGGWSPSKEASEVEWVRRNDSGDGDEGRAWGWPGLGIFEERTEQARKRKREDGRGWQGLGWVEYKPMRGGR